MACVEELWVQHSSVVVCRLSFVVCGFTVARLCNNSVCEVACAGSPSLLSRCGRGQRAAWIWGVRAAAGAVPTVLKRGILDPCAC